ncbi:hypothetical protein D9619_013350 [Psilocybe cf. subviscida]|uniref:Uncharacterized protein n=1 Tax=Psilocybe cf. subviscida TaxID=2480587 RepID=A0A8H5BSD3_9AGAR|nr:hypothetical protein D9619_013350 [Psilocybe cf. subviscida]
MSMFRLPFNLTGRQPNTTDAMTVDVELGDMHGTDAGQTEHPLNNPEAAAGPLSTTMYTHVQPHGESSGNHQRQSAKRSREGEDTLQIKSTRFVTAPNNLLQENEKQKFEMAIRKEISDEHQREIDAMKKDFDDQMAALR